MLLQSAEYAPAMVGMLNEFASYLITKIGATLEFVLDSKVNLLVHLCADNRAGSSTELINDPLHLRVVV